jgi:hypothetical protein
MVKRAFKDHRIAIILVAINSVIVVEEFAHIPGAFQWGIIGRFFDRQRRARNRSEQNAQFLRSI